MHVCVHYVIFRFTCMRIDLVNASLADTILLAKISTVQHAPAAVTELLPYLRNTETQQSRRRLPQHWPLMCRGRRAVDAQPLPQLPPPPPPLLSRFSRSRNRTLTFSRRDSGAPSWLLWYDAGPPVNSKCAQRVYDVTTRRRSKYSVVSYRLNFNPAGR